MYKTFFNDFGKLVRRSRRLRVYSSDFRYLERFSKSSRLANQYPYGVLGTDGYRHRGAHKLLNILGFLILIRIILRICGFSRV